ncbi:MAG: serine/threonine protein kinase [Anaerolineae bacterium]|nr:serine/threonine protein kinase [Anaerolineae bacterium]
MASLFDNRYRYDTIYPRGRSGETLRAYDTQAEDRPVVIKRPAPQDAPPWRAAQEISILNEKRALERLSGHPVLTELRGSAPSARWPFLHLHCDGPRPGEIIGEWVLALAPQNNRLPELETLLLVDRLLDLLNLAHEQQVVYNDVDAKHLFWDRDAYRLKLIDWGNAVFLDDPAHPANITPATDVYQVGELLYFLYQGGTAG